MGGRQASPCGLYLQSEGKHVWGEVAQAQFCVVLGLGGCREATVADPDRSWQILWQIPCPWYCQTWFCRVGSPAHGASAGAAMTAVKGHKGSLAAGSHLATSLRKLRPAQTRSRSSSTHLHAWKCSLILILSTNSVSAQTLIFD